MSYFFGISHGGWGLTSHRVWVDRLSCEEMGGHREKLLVRMGRETSPTLNRAFPSNQPISGACRRCSSGRSQSNRQHGGPCESVKGDSQSVEEQNRVERARTGAQQQCQAVGIPIRRRDPSRNRGQRSGLSRVHWGRCNEYHDSCRKSKHTALP